MKTYWHYSNSAQHDFVMMTLRQNGYSLAADAMQYDRVAVSDEVYSFWRAREAGSKRQYLLDV